MPEARDPAPQKRRGGKILTAVLLGFLGVIVVFFISFFVFYLWQIKYGSLEAQTKTAEQFRGAKFTFAIGQAGNQKETGPQVPDDITKYIRPTNQTIGNPNAKATIVAFIDFECPFSQEGYPLFKQIAEKYGPAARIVFKHLPLVAIHPAAMDAANAAACARAEGKFSEYYDRLFTAKKFDMASLQQAARDINLDEGKFSACLAAQTYQKDIEADMADAVTLGVRGTPTYFVNQTPIEGVVDMKTWDMTILNNLK